MLILSLLLKQFVSSLYLFTNTNSLELVYEYLWNINADQTVMDYFREDGNEILVIMLEVSAGLSFANLIIQRKQET